MTLCLGRGLFLEAFFSYGTLFSGSRLVSSTLSFYMTLVWVEVYFFEAFFLYDALSGSRFIS